MLASAQYHRGHYLQEGKFELGQKNYAKAIEKLSVAIGFEPRWYDAYFYRAVAKFELQDYKGAEEDFSIAIHLYPYDFRYFLYRGIIRSRTYNYRGALWDYERALDIDSTITEAYINRAVLNLTLRKYDLVLEDCEQAESKGFKGKDLHFVRGTALQEKGLYREAIASFNQVLIADSTDIEALLRRGVTYQALEVADSALIDFQGVLALDSNHVLGYFHRGNWYLQNKKYPKAIEDYNTSIRLSDKNSVVYFNRGIAWDNLNDHQSAIADFSHVLEMNPKNITAYFNRGGIHFRDGKLQKALADYSSAITIYPKYADAFYARSQVYQQLKRVKKAEVDYRKAMQLKAEGQVLAENVGLYEASQLKKFTELSNDFAYNATEETKGQYRFADIEFRPIFIIEEDPNVPTPYAYETKNKEGNRGEYHLKLQKDWRGSSAVLEEKIWRLDSLIKVDPRNTDLYLRKANLQVQLASFQEAFVSFHQALLLSPNDFRIWFSRANARLLQAKQLSATIPTEGSIGFNDAALNQQKALQDLYGKMMDDFDKAVSLEPGFVYAWYNRAFAQALQANYDRALKDLTECVRLNPRFLEAYYNRGLLTLLFTDKGTGCNDLSRAGELGMTKVYAVIKSYCPK